MAPTLPGGGTVVSGSSRRRFAGWAVGPAPRTLSAGKRKAARWRRRARETGSAEGQNSPHALLSQRRRGWPRPGEGRVGGLLTRSDLPAPPPAPGAPAVPAHVGRWDCASWPRGALLASGQPRGGNLRDPAGPRRPNTLALWIDPPLNLFRGQKRAPDRGAGWGVA